MASRRRRNGKPAASAAVVSTQELQFYKNLARPEPPVDYVTKRNTAIRARSQARYSTWTNTLEAQRRNKMVQEQKRRDQIEAAQALIDIQEQQFQDQKRKFQIDRANRILYQGTDRVKEMHSGLLQSQVLLERKEQLKVRERKKAMEAAHDKYYADLEAKQMKEAEEREAAMEESKRLKGMRMAKTQLRQLQERQERRDAIKRDAIAEGEYNKHIAELALRESIIDDKKRQMIQRENNRAFKEFNLQQQQRRAAAASLEAEEDKKIEKFAKEKEALMAHRAAVAHHTFTQKQDSFEAMLKVQHDHLKSIQDAEKNRTIRQCKELERTQDAKYMHMVQQRAKMEAAVRASRAKQVARKVALTKKEQESDKRMLAAWKRRSDEIEAEDRAREAMERRKQLLLKKQLQQQIDQKKERAAAEQRRDRDECRRQQMALDADDAAFEDYAEQAIADFEAKGCDPKPMRIILNKPQDLEHLYPGECY